MSRSLLPFLAAAVLLASSVRPVDAAELALRPIVPGFERFHAATTDPQSPSTADGGRLLLGELNCVSCHATTGPAAAHVLKKQAPILDDAGRRLRVAWLRKFLADPQAVKPGTTMPHVLAPVPPAERAAQVEDLVQFLSTTGTPQEAPVDAKLVGAGQKLFQSVGCLACHAPQDGPALTGTVSVPLPAFHEKTTLPALIEFLEDPHKLRPSGRMPVPRLEKNESRDVAHYLLRALAGQAVATPATKDRPPVAYAYYEGTWTNLPDFAKLKPVASGTGPALDVGLARRPGDFALKFDAVFSLDSDGEYVFELHSDDGSRLWIDGRLVVENDGIHAPGSKSGKAKLTKGIHQLTAGVFNGGGGCELDVRIAPPGQAVKSLVPLLAADEQALAARNAKTKPEPPKPADPHAFVFDPEKAARGKKHFSALGCAACHQLKQDGKPLVVDEVAALRFRPLGELKPGQGCLAPQPTGALPHYSLSDAQRTALDAALRTLATWSAAKPDAPATIARNFETFNCYACHVRGKVGGAEEARNALFLTTQKEMGDEGRLPPPLDGVGAKLQTAYLNGILANGATDRPYMLTRMPKFGAANVGHLTAAFEQADPAVTVKPVEFAESPRRIKELGRTMAGDKVFACVKCHNFQKHAATGVQSIDMTILTSRLKHDWFRAYMLDPQRFRSGTRMPGAWPQGISTLTDVLDGDANKQVEALWQYLADGPKAAIPDGILKQAILVAAAPTEATTYRNFIQGGGTHGIGVAYPEKINVVWDAAGMRLALLWPGAFLDASTHWQGRGGGYVAPLGAQPVTFAPGPSVAVLSAAEAPWPTQAGRDLGYRFKGYTYSKDRRPTFAYEFDQVRVEEFPSGQNGGDFPFLRHAVTVAPRAAVPNLWFRAASAAQIDRASDGTFRLPGDVRLKIDCKTSPVLVKTDKGQELRIPVPTADPVRIVLDYSF